jgi:hypothetical protein
LRNQEFGYQPTVDFNQPMSQVPPLNAANLTNNSNNMMNEEFISNFLLLTIKEAIKTEV